MTDLETAARAALKTMKAIRIRDMDKLSLDPDWPGRALSPHIAALEAALAAPGHTDLMVAPETLDAFMEANPLPPDPVSIRRAALEEAAAHIDLPNAVCKTDWWRSRQAAAADIRALKDKEPTDDR